MILAISCSFSYYFFEIVSLKKNVLFGLKTYLIIPVRILTSWTVIRISGYPHYSKFVSKNSCNEIYHRTAKEYKRIYTKNRLDKMRWASKCLRRELHNLFHPLIELFCTKYPIFIQYLIFYIPRIIFVFLSGSMTFFWCDIWVKCFAYPKELRCIFCSCIWIGINKYIKNGSSVMTQQTPPYLDKRYPP